MAVVGSAEVIVRAITKKVAKDIQKAFQDVRPIIANEGKLAGESYSKEFGKAVNSNLGDHLDNAVHQATGNVRNTLTNDLDGAASSAGRQAGNTLADELTRGGGRGGRGAGKSFARTFADDFGNAFKRLSDVASAFDILAPAIAVLVAGLSSVVGGLFAMASAASVAAGSLAVLPGIMGAVAQGFAVVKFAFGGISEALKLGGAAQDAAAAGAGTASKAAASAASNTAALTKAQDALTDAQEDAKAAQDALNKARDRAKGGAEAQEDAESRLAAAQQARNAVLSDPNASQEQGAAAQKAVDDAQNALDSITGQRKRQERDIRKAAEENDTAQDKLSKAQKARDAAGKAAGAGGIQTPAVKAANAYADALANLTPEARLMVEKILEMRASFKDLGEAIGVELFPRLTDALDLISDSSFFDILTKNLVDTGKIVGDLGIDLAKAFTADRNMKLFDTFLKANNKTLGILGKKTKDGTTPLQSLLSIFLKLAVAIQPITHRFVKWISEVVTGFDKVHSAADLTTSFNHAGNMAKKLGRIFRNIISIIRTLGGASEESGKGLLNSFTKSTKQLDKFLKKLRKNGDLEDWFEGASTNLTAIGDLVVKIGEEFIKLGDNEGIATFSKSLEPAVENLGNIFEKMTTGESGTALGDLFTSITEALDELTQSGQLTTFLETLTKVTDGIGLLAKGFNKIPGAGKILAAFAVFRAAGFASRILGFGKSFDRVRGALGRLIKAPFAALGKKFTTLARKTTIGKKVFKGDSAAGGLHKAGVPTTTEGFAQGEKVGEAVARGIAAGIRKNTKLVTAAIDDLSDAAIIAIKAKLGIKSPSVVFTKLGDQTADGFVLGLRAGTDNAYKAGAGLGTAAAAGARSTSTAAVGAGAVASKAATPIPAAAGAAGAASTAKLAGPTAKLAKSAGPLSKVGKAFGGLSTALLGLSGPVVLIIGALVALFFGLKALYKHSPAFRKFIDNIVDKFKDLGNWIKKILSKYVLPALERFFGWVNKSLPKIGKVFGAIFGFVGKAIEKVWPIIKKILGFIIDHWRIFLALLLGPLGIAIGLITKYWDKIMVVIKFAIKVIKGYVTKILIPIWKKVFQIFKALWPVVRSIFESVKKKIQTTFSNIKTIWEKVLKPVFGAIVDNVKDKFAKAQELIAKFREAFHKISDKITGIADGIKSAFTTIKDAVVGTFEGLIDKIKTPLGAVIKFINDNLIDNINKVTGVFDLKIPRIDGFAEGGYTGRGSKHQVAGVVHADEQVIKASSRRKIERAYPGLLDKMNRSGADGIGGWGPIGDAVGGVTDLVGDTVGGIKDVGKEISKIGIGKVLEKLVKGVQSGLSAAGLGGGNFVEDFLHGILDKLESAVVDWGGTAGKGVLAGGKWVYPLAGGPYTITNYPNNGKHRPPWAVDFGAGDGTPVLAASAGRIISAIDKGALSYGKYLVIAHAKGVTTLYAHLQSWLKGAGDTVAAGQQIAWSGHTGGVTSSTGGTGAHLHFEIQPGSDTLEELRKRGVKFAAGGIAKATSGGVLSVIAEAGKNERVEPLDSRGMSKRDKEILKLMGGAGKGDLTVNIHNPAPERAGTSVSKTIRGKAVASGWGV